MKKSMKYVGEEEREVPGIGVFKPGDVVEFNETLQDTGLFRVLKNDNKPKEAEE